MQRRLNILILLFLVITSCKKDKTNPVAPVSKGVYIINEGNFTFGNADISFYDLDKQEVTNNLFKNVNSYSLGDVAQSMYIKDSVGFIIVNNSQKIEVVKIPSFQKIRTISIPNSSPRYFLPVNDSLGYVTDLYAYKVHVINYLTGNVVKEITGMAQWTEHLLTTSDGVIVEERNLSSNPSNTATFVKLNTFDHSFSLRISFAGSNVNGVVKDKNGRIWLAVEQDSTHSVPSAIYCLNNDLTVNKKITLTYNNHPSNLCINSSGDELYYFDNDIEHISIYDTIAPVSALVTRNNRNFYGLGVDPVTEEIYVSDALDYVQPSRIYRYDRNGNSVHSFAAGVISGNFAFRYE